MAAGFVCRLADIPDGGAKGVVLGAGRQRRDIIVLRRGEAAFAYVNRCPHKLTPLETFPDKFLDQTGDLLICSTHGARFRVVDGYCVEGPCVGASLQRVEIALRDGEIVLAGSETP